MLFSEPKIPQIPDDNDIRVVVIRFSALQRAENSSKLAVNDQKIQRRVFQCSSASRKFLKQHRGVDQPRPRTRFSALQRAENSSNWSSERLRCPRWTFQCSSASRKFLKPPPAATPFSYREFQCSSASRKFLKRGILCVRQFYSEVSVLFSEPKIPQTIQRRQQQRAEALFQCSSASRKFLKFLIYLRVVRRGRVFQCSSASRKFLKARG